MTEADLEVPFLAKKPVRIVEGKGVELVGDDGRTYLDVGASYGVALLGHAHPEIRAVLARSADHPAVHFTYPHPAREAFYERLTDATGLDRVYPTSSGTEAIEAATKAAVAATGRSRIVAVEGAFHGRSLGALAATWRRPYREPFEDLLHDVTFVPPDVDAVEQAIDDGTALFLAEPVQGEAGVHPLPDAFLEAARERCRATGAVFALDEVQTGLGRTGSFLAGGGLDPDVVCLGKGLGNGYPVAACVVSEAVADVPARSHGGTFNGNPTACAVAGEVLEILDEEDLPARAARIGDRLGERLTGIAQDHGIVREVRWAGAMAAVDLRVHNAPILRGMADRGVLALSSGRTGVRFLPPLTIADHRLDGAVDALDAALEAADG